MHLYAFVRGQDDKVFRMIQDCQAVYFPYKWRNENGEVEERAIQMGVRPIQLYEFVFPEEELERVLSYLHPTGSWNKKYNKFLTMLRKLLGLKPVPKVKTKLEQANPIRALNYVEVAGVGIKKDRYIDGIEQL